jgi:two-component system cell cycle sensor histidine kinase/response regulator CckA
LPEPMKPPSEMKGTVLLVEDDHGVRAILTIFLERVGFRVLEAASCAEARQIWQNEHESLDVVVSDIMLPDGTGSELMREFRGEDPHVKTVAMSGGVPAPLNGESDEGGRAFLAKPFTPRVLLDAINRACAERETAPEFRN